MVREPSWDPAQYRRFADERARPGLDLIGRVDLEDARRVYDLGCGTGELTELIAQRYPEAETIGLDSSPSMLAEAKARAVPGIRWVEGDIATFEAARPADLIFSNAALQWLDDHQRLFPRLVENLAPGGILAVQMPRNYGAPSHRLMAEAAAAGPWRDRLAGAARRDPVGEPVFYYDRLGPLCRALDIWETEYLHVLAGSDAVFEWVKGTGLRPYLDALADDPPARAAFIADYQARLRQAYPMRADGHTLLPFRRFFLVARR